MSSDNKQIALLWDRLKWKDIENYLLSNDKVIIPVGSVEQHGPHLPVYTDWYIAYEISKRVSEKCGILVTPAVCYGMSIHHSAFPGTISLKPLVMISVIENILVALFKQGFKRILFVNAHGGNKASIQSAVMNLSDQIYNFKIKIIDCWEIPIIKKMLDIAFGTKKGIHATPGETSAMLYLKPEDVDISTVCCEEIQKINDVITPNEIRKIFPTGLINSDPTLGSAVHGEKLVNKIIECIIRELTVW